MLMSNETYLDNIYIFFLFFAKLQLILSPQQACWGGGFNLTYNVSLKLMKVVNKLIY